MTTIDLILDIKKIISKHVGFSYKCSTCDNSLLKIINSVGSRNFSELHAKSYPLVRDTFNIIDSQFTSHLKQNVHNIMVSKKQKELLLKELINE